MRIAEAAVLGLITAPLRDGQFDALVSFTFKFGAQALHRSTLGKELNWGAHADVPVELMQWVRSA